MKPKAKGTGFREPRKDQVTHRLGLGKESVHDTYKLRGKLPEPTVCPECGAVFHKGRWTWGARPEGADEALCPACHRIQDHYPAGMIHLTGPFFNAHQAEILNLVRNQEAKGKREHPLSRIISIEKEKDGVVVTTTDIHLPRRIGEALRRAHHGTLDFHYGEDPRLIRMTWSA